MKTIFIYYDSDSHCDDMKNIEKTEDILKDYGNNPTTTINFSPKRMVLIGGRIIVSFLFVLGISRSGNY